MEDIEANRTMIASDQVSVFASLVREVWRRQVAAGTDADRTFAFNKVLESRHVVPDSCRGGHVPNLESETGPRAGQVDAIMGVDLAHAAISSLSGEPTGRQEPSQSLSHCHAEPRKP